jgi:hypothetical protein
MKRLELPTVAPAPLSKPLITSLIVLTACVVVALLAPFMIGQVKGELASASRQPVTAEPWPTPPATYAPPAVVDASTVRAKPTQTPIPIPTPLPAPIWQSLNYLTSVEFTTSSVVEARHTTNIELGGVPLFDNVVTDRLLLKAVGKVQLGINLGKVSSVKVTGTKILLVAPKPEVISVELLPDQSQIYDSVQVWFLSQYQGLEKDALEKARTQLGDEVADNDSMTQLAAEMARLQLTEFLHKTGFTTVEITFK